jgi:hypothetical protein
MAVYVMLQVLPTMVSLKEWVVDFPDGMLADFAEALMRHHQTLADGDKIPRFNFKDYVVPVNEVNA